MSLPAINLVASELDEKIEQATEAFIKLFEKNTPCIFAYSSGKDSSATLALGLNAARQWIAAGHRSPALFITHSMTGDNPEVEMYSHGEFARIRQFADRHGINLRIHLVKPALSQSWAVRTIGSGKIPIFAGSGKATFSNGKKTGQSRDCTIDWKVASQQRARKAILQSAGEISLQPPVTVIGTRFEESTVRREAMEARGETADRPWVGDNGDLFLSPIANWDSGDVWSYLGLAKNGQMEAYSDFVETFRIYADAGASSCAVVADMALGQAGRGASCGTRTGCWCCTVVKEDKSLANMVVTDPDRYGYMKPLNQIQQFLIKTQHDWSRRNWLGRTVNKAGSTRIQRDVYNARMVEELLQYCLSADAEEAAHAARTGTAPRFQIISPETLVAIDAEWSKIGYHRPFHALKLWRDIHIEGQRFPVPDVPEFTRPKKMPDRYLYVGTDWDEGREYEYTGLRDLMMETFTEGCPGGETRPLSNGKTVMQVDTDSAFTVDEEALEYLFCFELDHLIERYHDDPHLSRTYGYLYYVNHGIIRLHRSAISKADMILRRTVWRERHGLLGHEVDVNNRQTISQHQMHAILTDIAGNTAASKPITSEIRVNLQLGLL